MQPDAIESISEAADAARGGDAPAFPIGRGRKLRCRGWRQEGLLRMLENTLANGERPQDLIIYAGTGKVARNWECFHAIVRALRNLADDETLVIQSGKPVAVFRTSERAPRVLAANTNLVGKWATWEHFRELEGRGLIMYGQYTAGTWAYIGSQGILQGTYETFAAAGARTGSGTLAGHIVLTAGLGGMGGAQPLAVKMAGGVCIAVEVDRARAERRLQSGYCDAIVDDPVEAIRLAKQATATREPLGIALIGNAAELFGRLRELGLEPTAVTDQTSAHDPLNGYVPIGVSAADAEALRARDPKRYVERSLASMARHVEAMLAYQADGAITFEYGNYLRGHALEAGVANANDIPGFVPLFVRPGFCRGRGPFRWVCLSGDPADLKATDEAVLRRLPADERLRTWMKMAHAHVPIQGLPARTCWLALGERDQVGLMFNRMVSKGELAGPIAMSRDHLDAGSVAQPSRETEGMQDGSDAVADWPLLNALLNTANGADLVTIHQGAGSGMGGSISAGMTVIADGTDSAAERIARALFADPAIGVVRHADAGYEIARQARAAAGLADPMRLD
ncbi:MAG: urocanate hydratase [Burkholderiales bacterium]|nr:urocanate hydratase [Burkholderiales bacterium]